MTIHTEHPFVPDPADRDRARRFRGRLAAPVTIVTAGSGETRAGLTVSSLMVVEGEPATVHVVLGPTSDLWDAIEETRRFVIHICRKGHEARAEVFAGLRPNPGGVFAGSPVEHGDWGPVISDMADRAYCTSTTMEETGYSGMVRGSIDDITVSDLTEPLVYFRGRYRSLG